MKIKTIIQIVVTLVITIYCCVQVYEQFKDIDSALLKEVVLEGLKLWPCYLAVLAAYLIALWCRAHRWAMMLNAPELLWLSFRSIALSYGAQLFITKGGELVRIYNQKRGSNSSMGQLMATVFIDRMLDFIALLFLLLFAFNYGGELVSNKFPEFEKLMPFIIGIICFGVSIILIFIFQGKRLSEFIRQQKWISDKYAEFISVFIERFVLGLDSIRSPVQFIYLFVSTLIIWFCYFLMLYFSIAFYPQIKDGAQFLPFMFIFTCSVLGMLVPVPAGLGAYHLFTTKGLMLMFVLSESEVFGMVTVAYIVSVWVANLSMALICLVYQFIHKESPTQAELNPSP